MVFHTTHDQGWTSEGFANATQLCMELVTDGFVAKPGSTLFRGKDQVNVDGGEGLGHGVALSGRLSSFQRLSSLSRAQGSKAAGAQDSFAPLSWRARCGASEPRVAAQPWVGGRNPVGIGASSNPNGIA